MLLIYVNTTHDERRILIFVSPFIDQTHTSRKDQTMDLARNADAIANLDLELLKAKLMHRESGEGWSAQRANAVEKEYRRFLCLMKRYPGEHASPTVDVDTFWHYHILDTVKYAADCAQVFGYFLHHDPYLGLAGEDGSEVHLRSAQRMRELYETTFGERYGLAPSTAAYCGASAAGGQAYPGVLARATAYCGIAAGPAVPAGNATEAPMRGADGGRSVAAAYCGAAVR